MKLGMSQRSLDPQQKSVVELCGIVASILVDNEGPRQGTKLQQTMPVETRSSPSRHFESRDRSRISHGDFGNKVFGRNVQGGGSAIVYFS
jgi:hypothetical protein